MTKFKITQQDITFFSTFGYLMFPGLLNDRIDEITAEFEYVFKKNGGNFNGKEHDFKKSSVIVSFIGQSEKLSSLLDDDRVKEIASAILGEDYNYLNSAGNKYVGDGGWHSDIPLDNPWPDSLKSINFSLYLDPVTHSTGALRVIPGSHYIGERFADTLTDSFKKSSLFEHWGKESREVPSVTIETRPGDVIVFNNYMKHATFGGGNNRRLLVINMSKRFPEDRLDELKDYVSSFAPYWVDEIMGEEMLRTAGPERMKHLMQILENEDHLPELSGKARENSE